MSRKVLATALVALSLSLGGAAFAQTQNSTDAGKRTDPDASSDVRETPIPHNQAGPAAAAQSTDAGKREDPDAASDIREQAMTPKSPQPVGPPGNSTDAGHHEDPDAASDAQEGSSH
jgi:hypothetical protein